MFATVSLPLTSTPVFDARGGALARMVQLITRESHQGQGGRQASEIVVGVVSDMTEVFAASRAAYRPRCEEFCLD